MMPVNEHMDAFALFADKHSSKFNRLRAVTNDHTILANESSKRNSKKVTWLDQQFNMLPSEQLHNPDPLDISPGDTVRAWLNGRWTVVIIDRVIKNESNNLEFSVRRLNSNQKATLSQNSIKRMPPDPSDFPSSHSEVDAEQLTHTLSKTELQQLWRPTTDDTVSPSHRLTLYWHHRLRCAPLRTLQRLSARGVLPSCIQHVRTMPLCASCAFATAHRKGWRTKKLADSHIRKKNQTRPGDGTSCDHIVSHQPGLIPQVSGILTNKRYWGSVIYCDHNSDFIFNYLITGTTSAETLASKQAYERVAMNHNVNIKAYHADNLRFNDNNFRASCLKLGQQLTFCAVGAHHQNAIAESKVKMVCNGARTILLHAKRKWPAVISHVLWPFAMQCIVDRHNRLSLDENNKSPLEKFSGIEDDPIPTTFHTFGCPTFVLDAPNQSGGIGTPKWQPRSHTGIYLGHSPCHASSVALVLNLKTGLVSPQYHVVYDDEFTTVEYLSSTTPPPNWLHLVRVASEKAPLDDEDIPPTWLYPSTESTTNQPKPTPISAPESAAEQKIETNPSSVPTIASQSDVTITQASESAGGGTASAHHSPFVNLESLGLRRSQRIAALPTQTYSFIALAMSAIATSTSPVVKAVDNQVQATMSDYRDHLDHNLDGSPNRIGPLAQAYLASATNNEVYTLKQMLQQPDRDLFIQAMQKEVESMFAAGIMRRVPKQEMFDHLRRQREQGIDMKRPQIMMIWSFKRKRNPDGTLNKHKARLCCHGGQQQWGVNYWDTYAPVVTWSSIRILMTIAHLNKLHTKSMDFIQAYPQAKSKTTIYLKTPQGIELSSDGGESVLKLERNLYGLRDAGRTWFEHLTNKLEGMGFVATASDPCIYTRGTNIIVLYVDDCIILSRTKAEANQLFKEIENQGFAVTDEGTMEQYLGMQIDRNNDGTFRVSQPFLLERIINTIPTMINARSAKTPAATGTFLTKDDTGEPRKENWHYRSLIGMLNYLVNSTQPELAYSVHQCARFCNNPKHSHEKAVKRIIRYLLHIQRTGNLGILFRPQASQSIKVFVEASFAGEWNTSWSEEPSSVFSRTGYLITFANCPIVWASKLQSEITLSTTESEYVAFSQSLRDVIPLIGLLRELRSVIPFGESTPIVHCTVHEDNKGCIDLVQTPRIRPRTKHIALKYHHFRSFVKDGTISVKYIDTAEQVADLFTKPLGDVQFGTLRKKFMGW